MTTKRRRLRAKVSCVVSGSKYNSGAIRIANQMLFITLFKIIGLYKDEDGDNDSLYYYWVANCVRL
jgi:aspartyl-tRNA synthetase